ncbi:MAG: NADH-quinone oxidoreductase subunit C [Geodermatophilaceae bacterium]|jgi:NADH-quinone oxidoreductase subunit C|nr:NADH-quinone oxidoreductase subunit C [Geodermatophilaceae bacterium]
MTVGQPDNDSGMFGVSGSGDTSGFGGLVRAEPGAAVVGHSTERPYGGYFDEVADLLQGAPGSLFDNSVTRVVVDRGEITFFVRPKHLVALCQHLRDDANLRFEFCSSVSGVDYLDTGSVGVDDPDRLHVAYHLTSMTYRRRIRLEVTAGVADPHIPSVTGVYPTADWQERETWDMFGVIFDGHPALTRILMPDDWAGHPQRKDYPLGGVPVEYKGATIPPPDERRVYQ